MHKILPVFLLLVTSAACGPALIPGTEVPDTPENREIIDLVETYRVAVESKDIDTLAAITSKRYFENASTTGKVSDDYGHKELIKNVLPILRDNIVKVVYAIHVTKIVVSGRDASVFMDYELTFQLVEGGQEAWATSRDKNRLDLTREDGAWKIVSGM